MTAAEAICEARRRAGLTQRALAERSGTSQATISAYEGGRKQPSAGTLARVLAAAGSRLTLASKEPVVQVDEAEMARRGQELIDVLSLADALPSNPAPELRYPPLKSFRVRST